MRNTSKLLVAAFVLVAASSAAAQTADEVADKVITATGGREALGKIQSRSSSGTMTIATPGGDIAGTIEVLNARPNKSRTLITLDLSAVGAGSMVLDQRFDGTTGYAIDSMRGNHEITGGQLALMKENAFPTPLLDYKARDTKLELAGKDKVGDRDALVLTVTPAAGPPSRLFIDAQTYLPLKSVVTVNVPEAGGDIEQTSELSDYRDVDGVKVPFVLKGSSSVQNFTITASTVLHNVKVDEALFSKPVEK
jgi:outer membrane lipoprotein-sorting protein